MEESFFKRFAHRPLAEKAALATSLIISLILIMAAYGKFFYPKEFVKQIDFAVSIFEIFFVVLILLLHRRWEMWFGTSWVFAAWSGYAFYWYCLKLPCSCMGTMLDIPTALSLGLDVLFFSLSLGLALFLGAKRSCVYLNALCGFLFCLCGYASAEWIYLKMILKV